MATATTRRAPALGRPTRTTSRGTRTGTLRCGPPVTIDVKASAPGATTATPGDLFGYGQPLLACFGKHTQRFGERGVGIIPKPAPTFIGLAMGQKHKNLFDQIVDPDNLWAAYRKASAGKRLTIGHLLFKQDEAANLTWLRCRLADGTYRPSSPRTFMVYEPKPREISALPFVDRVAQHAFCNVVEPIFDRVFLTQSYACRTGRGTHSAAATVQSLLRRAIRDGADPWVLKTDFSRYFASVRREVLHREYARKISCQRTIDLLRKFVPAEGCGLPIGNLTSQLSANIYGHIFDRWLVHTVGITRFARYMDDVVVVGRSREAMDLLQMQAASFANHHMGLKFSHWSVQPWKAGVNFCGYRIWPTHKLLRKSSVTRAKRKLRKFDAAGDAEGRRKFLAAWLGHASWADTHHLINHLGVKHA